MAQKTYRNGGYKKPVIQAKTFSMEYPPSERQVAIKDHSIAREVHLVNNAVAGSGKTTTINYIIDQILRMNSNPFGVKVNRILFTSFMNAIVDVQKPYYVNSPIVECTGLHALGRRAIVKSVCTRPFMPKNKTKKILEDKFGINPFEDELDKEERQDAFMLVKAVCKLVDLVRLTLSDWNNAEHLNKLVSDYGIDVSGIADNVYELVGGVMKESLKNPSMIDFADMLWMPVYMNLPIETYDYVFGDECQDYNKAQQALCRKASEGGIAIFVGDRFQAIMGFAGADCHSVDNLVSTFEATELPLDINYRCGKKIIEAAQRINPIIQAWDQSPDGEILNIGLKELIEKASQEDLVMSRKNKNLIPPCFAMLRSGKKAFIKGKDIGQELIRLYDRATKGAATMNEAQAKLEKFFEKKKERAGKTDDNGATNMAVEILREQEEMLNQFCEECDTVPDVHKAIETMFQDSGTGVRLSSCHAAKGLEADRAFIIDYPNIEIKAQNMTVDARQQERHLHYVALTRAKKQLFLHSEEERED